MNARRSGTTWALLLGVALAATSALLQFSHHTSTPPLYDGVGFPDEPYRYVSPPPGALATKPPHSADARVAVLADHTNDALTLTTDEKGPQVSLSLRVGVLRASATAKRISVSIQPTTSEKPPSNGSILGNAYAIAFAAEDLSPIEINGPARYSVSMRIPQGTRESVALELLDQTTGGWQTLRTTQTGGDIYAALVPQPGILAAVLVTGGDTSLAVAAGSGGSAGIIVAIVISVVVIVGVLVLTARTRALREAASAQPPRDEVGDDMGAGRGGDGFGAFAQPAEDESHP